MRLAGIVILYYPSPDVISNIRSYIEKLECLYVFDNSEIANETITKEIAQIKKTVYLHDGENKGIAARLNEAARLASKSGCNLLLTMDQDSHFTPDNLESYINCILLYQPKQNVSMFGIQYIDNKLASSICSAQKTDKLITSGSVLNLSLFESVGGFDENLFIDEVDLEYCYRSAQKGMQVIQFNNIFLEHILGTKEYHLSLKSFKKTPRILHSPIRIYYMTRNFFYLNNKYKEKFREDSARRKKALLNRIKNNLLYGKQRMKTIGHILKAYIDYKKNKMGKIK